MAVNFIKLLVLLLCYCAVHLALLTTILPQPFPRRLPISRHPQLVCLIGNAPNGDAAERVFNMWGGRFPGVYYLWNVSSARPSPHPSLRYISGLGRLNFADGLSKALEQARFIVPACEYYFTHDDDLHFARASKSHESLADTLVSVLSKYHPLVASFPWEAGHRMHKNLAEIHTEWSASNVGPLIGFDNGMVLYHASIVDFFIPFAPRGEGGFVGHWTLGAHFINLFVTTAFRNYSICINSLPYRNAINIDNLPANLRSDRVTDKNGLVYYKTGSRHPYEWPLNNAYKRFLSSGLKCIKDCRWGRDLRLEDIQDWQPPKLMKPLKPLQIAQKVASVFHIQHEALRNNNFLARFSDVEVQNLKLSVPYSLRINVFTFNRPESFERLWKSLGRALARLRCHCFVSVHVYQDYDLEESPLWRKQNSLLQHQQLGGVSFSFHPSSTRRGLRRMILSSWDPQTDDEFCLFLEDDIELADLALHYVDTLIRHYWYLISLPWGKLLGISLYRPHYSEVIEKFVAFDTSSPVFLYEYPSSWGQVFSARAWRAFLDWEPQENGSFLLPNSYTNRWPSSNSWKKALLRWMVQTGSVMLYPNVFGNLSFSTNHLECGTNDKLVANSTTTTAMRVKFTVPLVPNNQPWKVRELPALGALPQYDGWGNSVPTVRPQAVSSFDRCTVLMAVCHRVDSWRDRVMHFQNATFLHSFIVIWQNCHPNSSVPSLSEVPPVPFQVRIVSRNNSLNNRFLPLFDASTDCIISVDDDFDMPLRNISFAVDTWRGHFWNHLVGFAGFGRNHFWEGNSERWRYSTKGRETFSSIVLPTCFIYHRKYQTMYAKLPAEALHYVDMTMNCDDILFNFLVSNVTKSGPVVVYGAIWPVYVKKVEQIGGLWHRPSHFSVRSECLNYFVKVFGHMPLRYTTSYFQIDRSYGTSPGVPPGLRHHRSSQEAPPLS